MNAKRYVTAMYRDSIGNITVACNDGTFWIYDSPSAGWYESSIRPLPQPKEENDG